MKPNNFNTAFELMQDGFAMSRGSWPKDTFVFKQVSTNVATEIVGTMSSLPERIKLIFINRREIKDDLGFNQTLKYRKSFIKADKDNYLEAYFPSTDDLFAEDWVIYKNQND